jgi:hypothetical protein
MDKTTRNAIAVATQRARRLLETDISEQLEGTFDILPSGAIAATGGPHLSERQRFDREKIVAAIDHKRAAGMPPTAAVGDYVRDAAFTILNRFVALKMLEARELVQQCISKGEQSSGYKEFCGLAPGLALLPDSAGYRIYIESLFDELSTEVKVLFDRRDLASILWPRRAAFEALLSILNAPELVGVWAEDETLGWVYQYFNSPEERRALREASQAPRNSRELAIRNQFFTPCYVVQFLTDNTLGRIWYEMREGETKLVEHCEYLVRRPEETWELRARKDPRDLKILDPACGSGHFLIYSFDLLFVIYEEGWEDPDAPPSVLTGRTLREDYPDLATLRRALPGLVLRHNLHGIDIDPRCAQIAQLSLWMRAQRAFRDYGIARSDRPTIRRVNIVIAEPMPGERDLLQEFLHGLKGDRLEGLLRRALDIPADRTVHTMKAMADSLAELVTAVWDAMRLAGEMGSLLKIDRALERAIEKGRAEWEDRLPLYRVAELGLDHGRVAPVKETLMRVVPGKEEDFWSKAERLVFQALTDYVNAASGSSSSRLRLFADDAAQGFALIDVMNIDFDAVLMNPPFGQLIPECEPLVDREYPEGQNDIYAAFVQRTVSFVALSRGYVGAITSRAFVTGRDHRHFRKSLISNNKGGLIRFLDLGAGVLDGAMVETAAYLLGTMSSNEIEFIDARYIEKNPECKWFGTLKPIYWKREELLLNPQSDLLYDLGYEDFTTLANSKETIEPAIGRVTFGLTTKDDFRFVRLRWEISPHKIGRSAYWVPFAKGGEYAWFTADTHLLVKRSEGGRELAAFAETRDGNIASTRRSSSFYFMPAICFSRRSQKGFSARRLRPNACFSDKSGVILPTSQQAGWLLALGPAFASSEYQRLIGARSKFGSYEIGPIKTLPVPDARLLQQIKAWEAIYADFDAIERATETSEMFVGPPKSDWSASSIWQNARSELIRGLAAAGLTPDDRVLQNIQEWADERTANFNYINATRSWAVGVAFGRFSRHVPSDASVSGEAFATPLTNNLASQCDPTLLRAIYDDDRGSTNDLVVRVNSLVNNQDEQEIRAWLKYDFFALHINMYSRGRREAPIYWQLATSSASYSVWLYIHAFTGDTLYQVQNDYVAPKLQYETRRLEEMRSEAGPNPSAKTRREIDAQESFVNELRAFLDEVKRVAPLWNPDLDDGVIINFAPLWRLVPQHKAWQREVKAIWDALCAGDYDWAHLAMHLWPERVVPKCATDRSLAIAHGLEDIFWEEDENGKWQPRPFPLRPVEELVREQSSPAIKAALQNLLEAPVAGLGNGRGKRRSGRRDGR